MYMKNITLHLSVIPKPQAEGYPFLMLVERNKEKIREILHFVQDDTAKELLSANKN
jgi:hypothetical protein